MSQGDLLIRHWLRQPPATVEALDDDAWARALAEARWLEERERQLQKAAVLDALAVVLRK